MTMEPLMFGGEWFRDHETFVWWLGALSAITFVGTLVAVPVIVASLPKDYFAHPQPVTDRMREQHPLVRAIVIVLKNLLGIFFIIAGCTMLLAPGQGLLSIFIGLTLVDFPGKRKFELRMVRQEKILRAINWIRAKAKRPALVVAPPEDEERGSSAEQPAP